VTEQRVANLRVGSPEGRSIRGVERLEAKLHADALVVLLDIASTTTEDAAGIAKTSEKSDASSAKAIHETIQKLRDRSDLAVKALAHPGS